MTTFDELQKWAADQIQGDLDSVRRQITEYGSIDLDLMGIAMVELAPPTIDIVSGPGGSQVGIENALIFYLLGKISRCISAIAAGQRPSSDSYKDLRVYSFMLAHVREFGHWRIEGATPDATE